MSALGDASPWRISDAAVHELEHEGRRWRITVAQPPSPPAGGAGTPVVYVLDPFGTFGTAVQVARTTHLLSQGALPGLLLVGVGPASDDFMDLALQRFHDLTPSTVDEATAQRLAEAGASYGGADAFLDLLLDVVAPSVESEYGGDPGDRTIAGWSLGGLTGAHALVTRPGRIRRFLLVSPSLWWGAGAVLAAVHGLSVVEDAAVDVYLAAGELEETEAVRMWPPVTGEQAQQAASDAGMLTSMRRFADALTSLGLPSMTVHSEVLPGEHHITAWASAFSRGLLTLHAPSYRLGG